MNAPTTNAPTTNAPTTNFVYQRIESPVRVEAPTTNFVYQGIESPVRVEAHSLRLERSRRDGSNEVLGIHVNFDPRSRAVKIVAPLSVIVLMVRTLDMIRWQLQWSIGLIRDNYDPRYCGVKIVAPRSMIKMMGKTHNIIPWLHQ